MEVSIPTVELDTDHHVYQIKVQCATGAEWVVRRRFSEFIELRETSGLSSGGAALEFPRKRWFGNKNSEVVADRRAKLEAWLSATVTSVKGAFNEPLETFLEANHERLGRVSDPASRSNPRGSILEGIPSMQGPGPVTSSVIAETVLFCGQTLTRMNLTEVVRSEPAYAAGWICDGCKEKTSSSQLGETIYHGAVEPSNNPLQINAFDLCERCAADIPAAERRYQQKVDSAAQSERQRFRDERQAQAQFDDPFGRRRGRRRRDDHSGGMMTAVRPSARVDTSAWGLRGGYMISTSCKFRRIAGVALIVFVYRRCYFRTTAATASTTSLRTPPYPRPIRRCVPQQP